MPQSGVIEKVEEVGTEQAEVAGPERSTPPCRIACPAHVDVPRYVSLVAEGRFSDALAVVLETNPLPAVCGRACMHPCQDQCKRGRDEDPVPISALKRAAADFGTYPDCKPVVPRDEKVAVIGAGPAGLTAAYDLARLGFRVTIFEMRDELGGVLRYSIPPYRIPSDVLRRDIDHILSVGIKAVTGVRIGEDIPFDELCRDFDAVIAAPGLQLSRTLPIPGSDLAGIVGAMDFLAAINQGKHVELGSYVLVVGGGNVAVDAARSALRSGAESVSMVCLEPRDAMPATAEEVDEAESEGVTVLAGWGPREVLGDTCVRALRTVGCKSVFGEGGRFDPTFDEDRVMDAAADTIIVAIGQQADLDGLDVPKTSVGLLQADARVQSGGCAIFAAGDAVYGPKRIIDAVAAGHRVAARVNARFPRDPRIGETPWPWAEFEAEVGNLSAQAPSPNVPSIQGTTADRFAEVTKGFDRATAEREAQRCLACASKVECARSVSDEAAAGASVVGESVADFAQHVRERRVSVGEVSAEAVTYVIDSALCTGCHACVGECFAGAISGEAKQMHVIDESRCTGCGACAARCRVGAISKR